MRYFFHQQDELTILDELGREFSGPADAVNFAKNLAADLRCLETAIRPSLAISVVSEQNERVHREPVFQ